MAALGAAASRKTRNRQAVKYHDYVVGTNVTIYKGGLVHTLNSTGRAHPAAGGTVRKFAGLATETVTGTATGGETCRVEWDMECLINALTALTTAYTGATCILSTDNDVTRGSAVTAAVRVEVGTITNFESGDVWVHLRNFSNALV